ncbi:hypothetical protein D8B26_000401 [Coccidioides posadasii str. Silveira]|uniref:Uncharacterized protein n=3 Tax=Coccidioides posadasii TaxID=199306 RepID=E9DF59_COCPS|nr:hypothetical protein CPC735_068080 [Coccidioides posadasii C735 delta SOWgp]EER29126.1 hypothetical protein CPC735_068080 [Coccidioides posadasii C735 delta SOWgp]EFW14957.1 conserved hypothetical protein [Coccidioides posadasii str. Silveira]KMM70623.1 hypothetical protein CPAG_06934 [Coccidioides posadasii RMSCC 3488]QVM05695.1 hypothetical protein D8B26_000401 [Coccidioides posadasii str. Silveira]|eukprot:XP_003071271.1 hypothetical protein CPC735_068080 [Coccidioides posadasii C735 delta SOWgp]
MVKSWYIYFLAALHFFAAVLAHPIEERAANYHVAVVDQNSKTVRVFPRNSKKWNKDAIFWSFTADTGFFNRKWNNLSGVKIRKVAKHGWIALVTASGGKAGIVNITKEKRKVGLDDVMWQATPGDNPHSIEIIPKNGAIVVASSKPGKLSLYVPTSKDVSDYSKIRHAKDYSLPGAHGVLWDPNGGKSVAAGNLWVLGDDFLYKYKVTGSYKNTRLKRVAKYGLPKKGLGHDLQPDYSNKKTLLLTDSYAAYAFNTSTGKFKILKNMKRLKSLVRHRNGEYMWVRGYKDKGEMGPYVRWGSSVGNQKDARGWSDARFYKARIYDPDYE